MGWQTKTWVTGAVLPAADLNSYVRDLANAETVGVSTAVGDLAYLASSTGLLARLALGTTGQILMVNSSTGPAWAAGLPKSGFFLGSTGLAHVEQGLTTWSTQVSNGANYTASVAFNQAFSLTPNVQLTLLSTQTHSYSLRVSAVSSSGFTMVADASADSSSAGIFWLAKGSDT